MGNRRRSRELVLQTLYFMDSSKYTPEETLKAFRNNFIPSKKLRPFYLKLINGILSTRLQIDTIIERFSKNWKISRMSCVDRNVIRIAVFELLFCPDIPPKVSINEAIDVGKKYGTEESGAFINGILDSVRIALENNEIEVPSEDAPQAPEA